ncbi:MAG: PAS domain-containing protein, partial [Syntrophales bacterium LBB04]|nr:PAS domain-containing protein [Syntrophales bacterium LBB04]
MNKRPMNVDDLQSQSEAFTQRTPDQPPEKPEEISTEESRGLLHELQNHRIELEMQNQELRKIQGELEAARARYYDLYDQAPVGYITVNEKGIIQEANLTACRHLGVARSAVVLRPLTAFILREDQDLYYLYHKQLVDSGEPRSCEIRMAKEGGTSFWARLQATTALDADGAPFCRITGGEKAFQIRGKGQ